MRTMTIAMMAIFVLLLSGVTGYAKNYDSRFLIGGNGYKLEREDAIVIIFTHGSKGNKSRDPCLFKIGSRFLDQYLGTFRLPHVLEELASNDPRIALFFVCHREVGNEAGLERETRAKLPCQNVSKPNAAKFCLRKQKIFDELKKIRDANRKLRSSRIFLTGTSSGGWASLLLLSEKPGIANGVIAFAPATNGKLGRYVSRANGKTQRKTRRCGVSKPVKLTIPKVKSSQSYFRHQCQQEYIAKRIKSALVFAFEGDPYNSPNLLPLFQSIPRQIDFQKIERKKCGLPLPFSSHPHACFQKDFFVKNYSETIRRYLDTRLYRKH
ncbi:MAG: hypothetical protein GY761_10280 [Hyphomicrobiales bacterium]|nr:hypothetical protein [Hyphomicrobiales bacterium]